MRADDPLLALPNCLVVPHVASASERTRERMAQKAAANLIHPNVIQIYAYGIDEGTPYFAMEYVDGTTLLQLLDERGPLELQEAREIAAQMLSGLDAIHSAGLVHRDLNAVPATSSKGSSVGRYLHRQENGRFPTEIF